MEVASTYKKENEGLFQLYLALSNGNATYYDENNGLIYRLEEKGCLLQYKEKELFLAVECVQPVISRLVDLTEHILPAGTVVTIKKEYFDKVLKGNEVEDIKVVIVYRFLNYEEEYYFTYGGVIYPVSNLNKKEIIQFTPALIEHVVQKGYSDMQEDAFVYFMKNRLVLEEGRVSAGMRIGE